MIEGGNFDQRDRSDSAAPNPESTVESPIGIFANLPGPRTQATWREWLRGTNEIEGVEIGGDLDKKARVMLAIQMGVDYVEAEAAKQGIDYQRPLIGVVHAKRDNPSCPYRIAQYDGTRIFITTWHLDDASQYSFEEPIYTGATLPEYFFLAGVEEGHHALFDQREGEVAVPRLLPDTTSRAEYHAQDHEYEALSWEIEAAKAIGVPESVVEELRDLCQAATAVRRERASKAQVSESHWSTIGNREVSAEDARDEVNDSLNADSEPDDAARQQTPEEQQPVQQTPLEATALPATELYNSGDPPRLSSSAEGTPLADDKDRPDRTQGPSQGNKNGTPNV